MILRGENSTLTIKLCQFGFRYDFNSRVGLIIANSIIGVSTIVTNLLILISIWQTPSLRKPSHILIANLAIADFLVGSVGQNLFVIRDVFILQKGEEFFDVICLLSSVGRAFGYWPGTVSLYTLIIISIDRVLAIKLKTRYNSIVTSKRLTMVLSFGWVLCGMISFPLFILMDTKSILITVSFGMLLFMIIISLCYLKAVKELRKIMSRVSNSDSNSTSTNTITSFNISKYQRSLKTMLIVFATVMICCCPYLISTAIMALKFERAINYVFLVNFSEIIVFVNSTLNPLLYFWRIKELRQAAKKTVAWMFGRDQCHETTISMPSQSNHVTESTPSS